MSDEGLADMIREKKQAAVNTNCLMTQHARQSILM